MGEKGLGSARGVGVGVGVAVLGARLCRQPAFVQIPALTLMNPCVLSYPPLCKIESQDFRMEGVNVSRAFGGSEGPMISIIYMCVK